MNTLPPITIVICTYDRIVEIEKTIISLRHNLNYPYDLLTFHIADDQSPDVNIGSNLTLDYVSAIKDIITKTYKYALIQQKLKVTSSVTSRQGWGANVNKALSLVKDKIIYFTEDDYVLQQPIDLVNWVLLLQQNKDIGLVRFGIEGHTGLTTVLRESSVYDYQTAAQPTLSYLDIVLDQAEDGFGFYKYSNRPHLRHIRFSNFYGKYVEGQKLGKTEEIMNTQISDRYRENPNNAPAIICPLEHIHFKYDHIGHSRQHTAEDI